MVFGNRIGEGAMKFSKENSKSIIDEIYDSKRENYEFFIEKQRQGKSSYSEFNDELDTIQFYCKSDITKEIRESIKASCEIIDRAVSEELEFWQKKFYKLGFIDGMRMAEDIKVETEFEEE